MNLTTHDVVDRARMAYLALRTGDYRDLRLALDNLTAFPTIPAGVVARLAVHDLAPIEAQAALEAVREHGDEVFTPAEPALRRELMDVLIEFTTGH